MKVCSIFSQVLKLFSRGSFETAVKQHKAERHARGTSWGQFIAMLFCPGGTGAFLARDMLGTCVLPRQARAICPVPGANCTKTASKLASFSGKWCRAHGSKPNTPLAQTCFSLRILWVSPDSPVSSLQQVSMVM